MSKKTLSETIEIELDVLNEKEDIEKKKVKVFLQQASVFDTSDIFMESLGENKIVKPADFIKRCMGTVIKSPKDLVDQIEDSENAFEVISKLAVELRKFIDNPRIYKLKRKEALQKESGKQSGDVGKSTEQPNAVGNEKAK